MPVAGADGSGGAGTGAGEPADPAGQVDPAPGGVPGVPMDEAAGGSPVNAGDDATGGASQGGSPSTPEGEGGAPSEGAGGSMGGAPADGPAEMAGAGSPGCGSANPLQSGTFMVDIDGRSRNYVLDVPTDYDPNNLYRLVFVWHPLGGSASQVVGGGYNGLKSLSEGTAIFVAPDGLDGANEMVSGKGWWNAGGGDMKLFTTMLDRFNAELCIDQERIFSTGFSFGGMMSYTVGYQFDVFRAIAPCSGNLTVIPREDNNDAPLPIMAFHGDNDTFVTTSGGRDAFDMYHARNHCGMQTMPVDPSPCIEYQDCDEPTIWCEFPGGHEPWSQEAQAIWKFFSQF